MDVLHPAIQDVHVFILVFVRVASMLFLLPIFGSQSVPVQVKAGFAIMLSVMLTPFALGRENIAVPRDMWEYLPLLLKELFVGVCVGYAASFLFIALRFAGRLIDIEMGFAMVEMIDPFTDASTTTTGQLQTLLFTIVFLLVNGHFFLLLAIQKSFELIPLLGADVPSGHLALMFTNLSAGIFISAMKLAAPVYVILVLTSLSLGIVARTVPQMNVFFVGMPLKIGIGLTTIVMVLPILMQLFRRMTDSLMYDIWKLLYLLA